ncbi:hypothetical protein Vadar_026489 [Vaccinium darrowii]|uniref:Uncharacterized protein n=1 Tax=Vaccinium darrowii TaxID=229202 RepID=A0ACB7ZEH5_9ERIC|nr:hypothetical protein Vadar_026489 [Vaccinium darrowii]
MYHCLLINGISCEGSEVDFCWIQLQNTSIPADNISLFENRSLIRSIIQEQTDKRNAHGFGVCFEGRNNTVPLILKVKEVEKGRNQKGKNIVPGCGHGLGPFLLQDGVGCYVNECHIDTTIEGTARALAGHVIKKLMSLYEGRKMDGNE